MFEVESYKNFLRTELVRRIKSNPRYSQRAFARQLGISAGELSEVFSNKRHLSARSALKVAHALSFSQKETEEFLLKIQKERLEKDPPAHRVREQQEERNRINLSVDLFQIVSDWAPWALLSLVETKSFRWDAKVISKKLNLQPAQIEDLLARMLRVGLIERNAQGELEISKDHTIVESGLPSEALKNFHRQILQKALESIDLISRDRRDLIGTTFPVATKNLPEIRKEIRKFVDRVREKYSKKDALDEVYHLEMAFFPLTGEGV